MEPQTFFDDLSTRMRRSGISKNALCRHLDCDRAQVTRWWRKRNATTVSMQRLLDAVSELEAARKAA